MLALSPQFMCESDHVSFVTVLSLCVRVIMLALSPQFMCESHLSLKGPVPLEPDHPRPVQSCD